MFYVAAALFLTLVTVMFVLIIRAQRKQALRAALTKKLLRIRLVRTHESEGFERELNLSEQLFGIITSMKGGTSLEAAVHHVGEEIHFYINVPEKAVSSVSRQVEGLFKDAVIEPAQEYNIFHEEGNHAGVYLAQKMHYSLPIRTYQDAKTDTFSPILNGLSKVNEVGDGVALQLMVRQAPDSYKKTIIAIINDLRKGKSFSEIASKRSISSKDLQTLFGPEKKDEHNQSIVDQESLRALEEKITKPLLQVNYRIVVSTPSPYQTNAILEGITASFSQFDAPLKNGFTIKKPKNLKRFLYTGAFRMFDEKQSMILNTQELASIFHLPGTTTLSANIGWVTSRQAAPPTNLPAQGTPIGITSYRSEGRTVYITPKDRNRHVYCIGQTGTGKSTLLINMAHDDIKKGRGVAVVDPHGDLVEAIAGLVPKEREQDVIVVDPAALQRPIGLNMLEHDVTKPEERTFIVNEIQSIFNKLFSQETMGPMFEQYMRNALLLLMEDMANEPATLMEVPRVFTDEEYRKRKLERIHNPVVIDFWTKEAMKVGGEASLANITPYITSKFNNFIANDYIRPMIGQEQSSFSFRKVMDENKILLVNLSKGKIGDINAGLLGMIVVGKLLMAALSRANVSEQERKEFNLYIDEFQNFTTDSIAIILSEARKYKLNLTVAHQFIAQLEEKIRDAVFGNVGSMIAFRVGARDAEFLESQFAPTFTQHDLMNISNYNAHAKLLINGEASTPFTIATVPSQTPDLHRTHDILQHSLDVYGRERNTVEQNILQRMK